MARLAVAKMDGVDWSDADAIANLRIGDFACGTGALLSAVYDQVAARHERAGGDPADLHRAMMEEVLYGCDVMPSAIHITGSTLSGMQPSVGFGQSRLYTMPYGRQENGSVSIGSLELLQSSALMTLFNMSDPVLRTGSAGEETAAQALVEAPDGGFDLVIMNPPFTSNTKHYDAGDGVLNAAFAAYNSTEQDQAEMADLLNRRAKGTVYHGHAGMASAFAELAHRKVRPGGIVAFVLPLTLINGSSWRKFRALFTTKYTDLTIVSISNDVNGMSFSSDTGMADCLVIGRKLEQGELPRLRSRFSSLQGRPMEFVQAMEFAKSMLETSVVRQLEDGPYGGTSIYSGDELIGEILDAPVDSHDGGWRAGRIVDTSVAQTAYSLSVGKLWLPGKQQGHEIPIASLNEVGRRGLHHGVIAVQSSGGPFVKSAASPTATYPALWNHNATKETFMVCDPDSQLIVRQGMETKAANVWSAASCSHLNLDFRFNSQPLAVAVTETKSMGGRAWPNVIFTETSFDYAFAIWCNSTLGLLSFWWHSNRQHSGRGTTTVTAIESLPILDFRALSDEQLEIAEDIFEEFREKELKPAYIADADPNRALLDKRVVCDLLGFSRETYEAVRRLSAKWCAEPSVHGGKRRPRGASLVM